MSTFHSRNQVFQDFLARALSDYFPSWEKGDLQLGVATKTLRRWIDGSNTPNDSSLDAFLDAAALVRDDFPVESIREAYRKIRNGRNQSTMEQDGLIGSDAYDRRFSDWCAHTTEQSVIWIFQNWLLYPMKFTDEFVWAVKEQRATARMLLLHPDSSLVDKRYETTKLSTYSYLAYLEDMPRTITKLGLNTVANFELRFYEAVPPFASYVVDDNILFAPLWARHTTSEAPHLVMTRNSAFGRTVVEDIEFLWNASTAIRIDEALTIFVEALRAREAKLRKNSALHQNV